MELDKDLAARQEARICCRRAEDAQKILAQMSQETLDRIVEAVAREFHEHAQELARLAVEETGFGNIPDKTEKNRFASRRVSDAMRPMRCVGVLSSPQGEKLWKIGVPVGVIAAIVPSTNPTSTVCYKALICLKSGNAVVFSPHPSAVACTVRAAQIVASAAERAGAPSGCVACLHHASLEGCRELMQESRVRLILATGGPAMVRAAYSSGKPAIGVGAGNGPAYIHRSADVKAALEKILRSKTFDNGTVCASEQSIIVQKELAHTVREEGRRLGYYFTDKAQSSALAKVLFRANGALNPEIVGKTAVSVAKAAGFDVPSDTKVLVADVERVGSDSPFSKEKLCPVLGFFVEETEDAVLDRVIEILCFEGKGHTFCIHAEQEDVIRKFAMRVPVSRFLVNTPAALGGIGATTELFPALTLGCGAVGGSASSNNISPMDLINLRTIAFDSGGKASCPRTCPDETLVDILADKILERLNAR